jgi:aminocarboxymuconate-semialdehyde decarboxylase
MSASFRPAVLEALIARVGADRIVLGSDYPFGEDDPIGFLRQCSNASDADVEMMASKTPAGLLGLKR